MTDPSTEPEAQPSLKDRLHLPELTPRGGAAATAALVLLFAGLALGNPLPTAAGLVLVTLLTLGAVQVGGLDVEVEREMGKRTTSERDAVAVVLRVRTARGGGNASFEIRDRLEDAMTLTEGSNYDLLDLDDAAGEELRYEVTSPVKGTFDVGPVELRLRDAFGFFVRDEAAGGVESLKVFPRPEDLDDVLANARQPFLVSGAFHTGQPGGGTDFFALRDYLPGDPMRSVNWKASSKSGDDELIVNQWERESQTLVTLLFDAREVSTLGTAGANANVYGARAVVSLMGYFFGNRDRVQVLAYGDGLTEVEPQGAERMSHDVRELMVQEPGRGAMTLGEVVDEILPSLSPRTPVVIVSNLAADPSVARAVRNLRARDLYVTVVVPPVPEVEPERLNGGRTEHELGTLERQENLRMLRGYDANIVNWEPGETLEMALGRVMNR